MVKSVETDLLNFANYVPSGLVMVNLKDQYPYMDVIIWNKPMEYITGHSFKEVDGKVLLQMFDIGEKDLKPLKNSCRMTLKQVGETKKMCKIITKNGERKILDMSLGFRNDEEGKCSIIALIRDITDEKELKEIEERYKKIIDNSTDAILIYGDLKIIYINKKGQSMLEVDKREDVIGQSLLSFVHPDYHEVVNARIKESQEKEGSVKLIEEKFITIKGNVIDVEIQMTYIPYNGEKCNVAFIRDITERKAIERNLKKSKKYFRNLFNNVNDAIFLNKIDENGLPSNYVDVNNVGCSRLGYTREELRTMTVYEVSPSLNKEDGFCLVDKLRKEESVIYETVSENREGKCIPVEVNSIFLILDNEKHILSISRDISERKKNEQALKKKSEEYINLVQALPYGVYIQNNQGLLFANKVGLDYIGLEKVEDAKGKAYSDILKPHPEYVKDFIKNMNLFKESGCKPLSEVKLIRVSDNKVLDLETIAIKYPYGDTDDTFLVVVRDISDRKKAQALERDMDEKTKRLEEVASYERMRTEFFANISHELRTPVNVIFSALQLINYNITGLKDDYTNVDGYKKNIDIMKQNCFRLVRLINNLIDVTKIDSGYFNLNLVNCNIISIVEDITQSVAEYISNKGVNLIFDTEVEEKIIACDPEKIERIMLNLISNAVKFTPPGGSLFVNIKDKGESIIISVRDTGIGIPKNKQELIFERFIQVDKSLARQNEGSGIGLSLVKSLVEMHKGTIRVESEEDKGSEFFIELPVYRVEEDKENLCNNDYIIQDNVEKINVEFSDIYF